MKICSACKLEKNINDFYKDSSRKDGVGNCCKICSNKRAKIYRENNLYKISEINKTYYKNNPHMLNKWLKNNPDKAILLNREWRNKNPERRREHDWKRAGINGKDGLPLKWPEYLELMNSSGGGCQICGAKECKNNRGWDVDHDHGTGIARGLLCHDCNLGLGNFKDSLKSLKSAIKYLIKANLKNSGAACPNGNIEDVSGGVK